jgi:hypothetical protein
LVYFTFSAGLDLLPPPPPPFDLLDPGDTDPFPIYLTLAAPGSAPFVPI